MFRICKYLWASPNTLLGLLLLFRGKVCIEQGVIEGHGPVTRWVLKHFPLCRGAAAMTLGHVVIGLDWHTLDETREHERVHVRQYERWGPFFIPAYLLSSLYLWLRGRDAYYENPFEVEAYSIAR